MNILEIFSILFLSVSSVQAIGLLPCLQGTDWYAGETVYIQAVQNKDTDGSFYNAWLKSDNLVEKVLTEAPYQQYVPFVVPAAFDNAGSVTLYVVAEGKTGQDNLKAVVWNSYYYNQRYTNRQRQDNDRGCNSCRI